MPTQRGFVERLEIGRAGLVVATLRHDDDTRADYQIPDLDADPERFNERLSKLGLLRDALGRAEPVEIEYEEQDGTRIVARVTCITRDQLAPTGATTTVSVMVVGVVINAENRTDPHGETSDLVGVIALSEDGIIERYVLDLQIPERAVAEAQLTMIRDAQAAGETVILTVDSKTRRIVAVQSGGGEGLGRGLGKFEVVDGFVESIAHEPITGGAGDTADIGFTTAPPFNGADGNIVDLIPFTPQLRRFLVVVGSTEYKLFLVALRDKLRMRVLVGAPIPQRDSGDGLPAGASDGRLIMTNMTERTPPEGTAAAAAYAVGAALVRGAQILHALTSASRPVWIQVSRKSLDVGPEAACTEGLPSSDLTPRTLRDLHLPYSAEWVGFGCFNHGVYRFQFTLESPFTVEVDCKECCVYSSADGKTQFAHACLDGEHQVRVRLSVWTCAQNFQMDVYRIR